MRRTDLIPALMILGLAGCQMQDPGGDEHVGETQLESIGGMPALGQAHYEAAAAITILLPLSSEEADPAITPRVDKLFCTGVLIEARTVMTAAGCLARNLEFELNEDRPEEYLDSVSVIVQFGSSASAGDEFYLDATFEGGPNTTKGLTMHRYYDSDFKGRNDIALLRLSADPGITPVAVNGNPLSTDLEGTPLELVGYGKNEDQGDQLTFTARNVVAPEIIEVTDSRVKAGTVDKTTCFADQGGPGFVTFDSVPTVVTVSVTHDRDECLPDPVRQRVDLHAADFIEPFITFASGGCDGGACDDCDYNGTCKEDCPTRDWDCEIGAFTGDACSADGECEEAGHCIAATDDPSFTYCAKPCDAAADNPCPSDMTCEGGECIYAGISPGSQGAACGSPGDCRSGFCENSLCAFECDAGDANACDADSEFFCLPSLEDPSTTVCRIDLQGGGGGFCSVGPAGSASRGAASTFLACFGLFFLVGLARRRRS